MKSSKLILLFIFLTILLTGCDAQPDRLWLKSPDWSRAKLIGNTRVGDPVQVAIDNDHTSYLFFIQSRGDRPYPRTLAFNRDGELIWDLPRDEISLQLPANPQILWDGNNLLLFWLDDYKIYGATMDTQGEWIIAPKVISKDQIVVALASAVDQKGTLSVWFSTSKENPGLYAISDPFRDPDIELVDPQGVNPQLIYDLDGTLHATWARNPRERGMNDFVYGVYPSGDLQAGKSTTIVSPVIYGTTVLEGPNLGIDANNTYVFWSITFFSGPEAGTVRAQYVFVPRGEFEPVSTARIISVPWSHDLIYEEADDASIRSGRRVLLEPGFNGGGNYVVNIYPNQKFADELAFTFQARLGYLMRKVQSQVSVAYLKEGFTSSYQPISFTQSQSSNPFLASDDLDYLHLTWLEKGNLPGWAIYYTSTAPGMVRGLGGTSGDDVSRTSIEVLFGLAIGALLIPIAIAWTLPSTLILLLILRILDWLNARNDWAMIISLPLSILVLWVVKIGLLPGILSYTPFSAWIPFLPPSLTPVLRIAVPVSIMTLGILIAWKFTLQREERPILQFFLIYSIVDGVLSMAIYGVLIIATF
ncbi:MAG: hypothetical protein PVF18_04640 [Anaerolineales bacterium]|jgi:hypothetical protein